VRLEEYQRRAVQFLTQHPRAVLSMDMGLGKTAVVIEALHRLGVRRALIVAPKRVALTVWRQEAEKWNDPHTWTLIEGTPSQRKALWRQKAARTVCSYEQLKEAPTLDYEAVVFDELTRLKHVTSKRFLYALGIRTAIRWGLTGTLLPNGAVDLFGQLAALGIYAATPHVARQGKIYIPEFFPLACHLFRGFKCIFCPSVSPVENTTTPHTGIDSKACEGANFHLAGRGLHPPSSDACFSLSAYAHR